MAQGYSKEISIEFFAFTLIAGIVLIIKAAKLKPVTTTDDDQLGTKFLVNTNYDIDKQDNFVATKTRYLTTSTGDEKQRINENEIYGLVNDIAAEGIEDEVRDYLEYEREEHHDRHNNDNHSDDKQEYDEINRDK